MKWMKNYFQVGTHMLKTHLYRFQIEWDVELDYIINPSALAEKAESKGAYKDMRKVYPCNKVDF